MKSSLLALLILASPLKADETVVFFETAGWRAAKGEHWVLPIHAWVYEPEVSVVRKAGIEKALEKKFGLEVKEDHRESFDRRVNLLLGDNERGKVLRIRIGNKTFKLPETEANGQVRTRLRVPSRFVEAAASDGRVTFTLVSPEGDARKFEGTVHLVEPTGVSVISDIDDTVKLSHVRDHKRLMEMTFLREFEPAPGMPEMYTRWAGDGMQFHFVSSSPWQLYEPLEQFFTEREFPAASVHLKTVRVKDKTIFNLFKKGTKTKPYQIIPLLEAYPSRKFVLVGDTGEHDPEVYARLMGEYPKQVLRIYLRNVTKAKRSDKRFKEVFRGVPPRKWILFDDPSKVTMPDLED